MKDVSMENVIGKKVFLKINKEASNIFKSWSLPKENIICTIVGVEEHLGIWIIGNKVNVKFSIDKSGKKINPDKAEYEKVNVNIFIPWKHIEGIMSIKDKRAELTKDNTQIGFQKAKRY